MQVTVGRTVMYTLTARDAEAINRRRIQPETIHALIDAGIWVAGAQAHVGTAAESGQVFPMVVVKSWAHIDPTMVNGQVLLDGTDVFWATSVKEGSIPGTWAWPHTS